MLKKTLVIMALLGLLLLPLCRCAKSDELSDAEVNEAFNALFMVFDQALSEANASAMATTAGQAAGIRPAGDITYTVNWVGSGRFEGVTLKGSITANPESGYYAGDYTFTIFLFDASPSPKKTVIINSATGLTHFSGNAYQLTHGSNNDADFNIIIGTKQCNGTYDYDIDAVGTSVKYTGTVVFCGKEYNISNLNG